MCQNSLDRLYRVLQRTWQFHNQRSGKLADAVSKIELPNEAFDILEMSICCSCSWSFRWNQRHFSRRFHSTHFVGTLCD